MARTHGKIGTYNHGCRCVECKEIRRIKSKAYYHKNIESERAYKRKKYHEDVDSKRAEKREDYYKHAGERKAKVSQYQKRHPEKVRVWSKKYLSTHYEQHREICRIYQKSERGRFKKSIAFFYRRVKGDKSRGEVSLEQLKSRWDLYGGRCWLCSGEAIGFDHVIPLGKHGTNWPANLRPVCKSCNSKKHLKRIRSVKDWIAMSERNDS